ncbi:MAG: hypothetical protein LBF12_06935 [Christensenellaceae bacterium]|nr:hypothetical protein [Christensenellaceae bacterium]
MRPKGKNEYYPANKVGYIIGIIALVLVILSSLPVIHDFMLSVFGYVIFVYLLATICISSLLAGGLLRKISKRTLCFILLISLLVICTLHIAFSKTIINSNSNYLLAPLQKNNYKTVGGILISIITFPLAAVFGFSYSLLLIVQFAITLAVTLLCLYLYFNKKVAKPKNNRRYLDEKSDDIKLYSRMLNSEQQLAEIDNSENQPKVPIDYEGANRIFLDPLRVRGNRSISEVFDNAGRKKQAKPLFSSINEFHRDMQTDPLDNRYNRSRSVAEVFGDFSATEELRTLNTFEETKSEGQAIPIKSDPIANYMSSFKVDQGDNYTSQSNREVALKTEIDDIIKRTPLFTKNDIKNEDNFVERAAKNSLSKYSNGDMRNLNETKERVNLDSDHEKTIHHHTIERHTVIEDSKANIKSSSAFEKENIDTDAVNSKNRFGSSSVAKPTEVVRTAPIEPVVGIKNNNDLVVQVPDSVNGIPTGIVPKLKNLKHPYCAPPHSLLKTYSTDTSNYPSDYAQRKEQIENELSAAGISANVYSATRGAVFTRYEMRLDNALQVSRVKSLNVVESLKMRLKVKVLEIEAPIKGKDAVGILFQNDKAETVGLKSIICSSEFICQKEGITFALGQDIDGVPHVANLAETSHLIVAGATNTGKSVFMNSMLVSILFKHSPEDVRFIIIDPKRVEFVSYKGLPHMLIKDPITEIGHSLAVISWVINEMERRYTLLEAYNCRKLDEYNNGKRDKINEPKLPRILLVVDEMADLMLRARGLAEDNLTRIAQKGRAAGIHMVIATQKPTVNIISGLISANVVNRVAFQVIKNVDSRVILDDNGAEELVGRGDMLYKSNVDLKRMQGAYLDSSEIDAVCDFIKANNEGHFDEELDAYIRKEGASHPDKPVSDLDGGMSSGENDPLFRRVLKAIILDGKASTNSVVTNYSISYIRAKRMIDAMTKKGYLARENGNKARDVLLTYDQYKELYGEDE